MENVEAERVSGGPCHCLGQRGEGEEKEGGTGGGGLSIGVYL